MTDLKELAVAATGVSIVETDTGGAFRTQMDGDIWGRFVSAASPETVLELIERVEALEHFRDMIIRHYPNQDMKHVDFRVHAYKHALTLRETKDE